MRSRTHLLDADPDLADGLSGEEHQFARRALVAETLSLGAGAWYPDTVHADRGDGFAILVLRGALTREVQLAGRRSAELFGPGDLLGRPRVTDSLVPHDVSWTVTDPSVVAILDDRFRQAARRWPSLAATLEARLLAQAERLSLHVAIAQLGRVDLRLLAFFWHLADRWGRVTPQGIAVPLKLTHEALGRLVGAQRPTVTLALRDLEAQGNVARLATGGWLVHHESRVLLASPEGAPAAVPPPAGVVA